ncbi:MAG: transcription-repair coupling factor, partial [Muribaculaceae bacterium]|nr:transcription-repair coupling factor [Muribaculaceae bacterium]
MTLTDLSAAFLTPARRKAITRALSDSKCRRIGLYNMAGSSPAMLFASMDSSYGAMIIVGDSPDDAGYIYHDLTRLMGEEAVMYFPSSYKRDIKYGQLDGPSRILRTETLSRWMAADGLRYVVTYPEALAEKVASAKDVSGHTIVLSTRTPADLTETQRWLRDNGFKEVDYVYEPGQWAVRGSILDIFGYSNELPYRLDFFGDDID